MRKYIDSKQAMKALSALWDSGRKDLPNDQYQCLCRLMKEHRDGITKKDSIMGTYRRLIDPKAEPVLRVSIGEERRGK